mgnify:CR=1 FL=1|tara:strand:+ start:50 stop:346 length:297 start_codon:yes stop_codon:yes gene_type:complete
MSNDNSKDISMSIYQQNMIDDGWDVDCLNEHFRFRTEHLIGERKGNTKSIFVSKNWYDCSYPNDGEITSVIIDNKYEKKYYHTTLRNEEGKWVHILSE